ncbi:WhiB family transcriptional regulator [Streptomyces sp. 5.8]|uniref:WhiB family transcriptional regulator n=1 Tax=Streptomyces sp. 5.8 TaxID=3406571 RepID=UPI003BB661D7
MTSPTYELLHETDDETDGEIATALAGMYSVAALADGGYLSGPDGRLIAGQMREPRLSEALLLGRCSGTKDVDAFQQADDEPTDEWQRRRESTIARYCAPCPVVAACLELALRYPEHPRDLMVRGGATEEDQLALGKAHRERLAKAEALDARPAEQRSKRLCAAREVTKLAQSYMRLSLKPEVRNATDTALRAAASDYQTLTRERRLVTGWTA